MRETDLHVLMERATEDTQLPAGLTDRVFAGARARSRRRRAGVAGLVLATACGAALVVALNLGPASAPQTSATVAVQPATDPLTRLAAQLGRPVDPLVYGEAGSESLVILRREANEDERKAGGKAAEMWAAPQGQPFTLVSDYLSYDFGCAQGDKVCEELRPSGLGFAAVRVTPQGRAFVLVALPAGRTARVAGVTVPTSGVVEVSAAKPWEIEITVSAADGRSYVLPLPPGGVVQ